MKIRDHLLSKELSQRQTVNDTSNDNHTCAETDEITEVVAHSSIPTITQNVVINQEVSFKSDEVMMGPKYEYQTPQNEYEKFLYKKTKRIDALENVFIDLLRSESTDRIKRIRQNHIGE